MADAPLAGLRADARRRVPDLPELDEVIEDTGRQRLAAYYLYSALLAGVTDDLAPARWPPELAEPVQRLGLTRFAPRTGRGLDAWLTPAEQATRQSPDRHLEFARLLVDLINQGRFGPLCHDADRVRLSRRDGGHGLDLELIKGWRVVGACPVKDHWELVAQHLADTPPGGPPAQARSIRGSARTVARRAANHAIPDAVSEGVTLAAHLHPLGTIAGLGTHLIRSRIQAGRDQADAFRRIGQDLGTLCAQAEGELAALQTGRRAHDRDVFRAGREDRRRGDHRACPSGL
jgi:hypothetical protein